MVANSAGNATVLIDNATFVEQAVQPLEIIQFVYFALWGMYSVLFGVYVYFQGNFLNRTRKRSRIYPASLTLLYLFVTMHTITSSLSFNRVLTSNTIIQLSYNPSFSPSVDSGQHSDSRYFELLNFNIAADLCYMMASLIADGILICRCYHLWAGRKSIVAAPFVLYIFNLCLYITALIIEVTVEKNFDPPISLAAQGKVHLSVPLSLSLAYTIGTVVTNLLLIGLIAGRIFWSKKTMNIASEQTSRAFSRLVVIILESGFLYTFSLIVAMCLLPVVNPEELLPITAQAMGIAPTLIMVRMEFSASVENISTKEQSTDFV